MEAARHSENEKAQEDRSLPESNWEQVIPTFDEMGLKPQLLRGIHGCGFDKPSPIQTIAIAPMTMRKDVIAQARPGSGKTAASAIGALHNIDTDELKTQALILAPTRELASGINSLVRQLGDAMNVRTHACVGGVQVAVDKKALEDGVHVVVGTPGRVRDMVSRQILDPSHVRTLVVDEADEMFVLGHFENVREVVELMPPDCQVCLFSATMSDEIFALAKQLMKDPVRIVIKKEAAGLQGVKQFYLRCVDETAKAEGLARICSIVTTSVGKCLVLANTKEKAEKLVKELTDRNLAVACIHGSMTQEERNKVASEFNTGSTRIVVTTDPLSRGIDPRQVGLVVNCDLPERNEDYMRRVERSGCFGGGGVAISLIIADEAPRLAEIQKQCQTHITEVPKDLLTMFH